MSDDREMHERLHREQRAWMARLLPGHAERLRRLEGRVHPGYRFPWRIAECPAVVPRELFDRDVKAMCRLLTPYLEPAFRDRFRDAVPERFRREDRDGWFPSFVATDFQRVFDRETGTFTWCCPEVQSFPGNLLLKPLMLDACRDALPGWRPADLFAGTPFEDQEEYAGFLAGHLLQGSAPAETVITDVDLEEQPTLVDMLLTARRLGCRLVDLSDLHVDSRTAEVTYRTSIVMEARGPRRVEHARPQRASRIIARCVPDEVDAAIRDPESPITPAFVDRLFRETGARGTVSWAVHPQDFFVLSKATLVGNPHHHPPLLRVDAALLEGFDRGERRLEDGVVKPAYGAGGRGVRGFEGAVDREALSLEVEEHARDPGMERALLWQERYGADLFERTAIEGYRPGSTDAADPIYHELRLMWAAGTDAAGAVTLTLLTGLTRWSRKGHPANARHQRTPFTGTQGILVLPS